jgi:23S rRNA (guanosine2251-2'-O)-methyltransferase
MTTENSDWIVGRHPVREALEAEQEIHQLWIAEGSRVDNKLLSLAKEKGIPVKYQPRHKMDKRLEGNHQGVAAEAAAAAYGDLWEILDEEANPLLVLLDQIEDPHNMGAIIRSAEALGATAVVTLKRRAAGLTGTVSKASAGALAHLPVCRVPNLAECIQRLKERDIWTVCADFDGTPLPDVELTRPLAIVIGSEGSGVRRLVRERCDQVVTIPLSGKVASLNASAAAAIVLSRVAPSG